MAAEGVLDPLVGRQEEIGRVIQILSRRTKNKMCIRDRLYDVADFYDLMQHCYGNTDFYRYRDGTAFCTDRICVFPVSVSWNTEHRRPQGKGGTETKISCPLSYI